MNITANKYFFLKKVEKKFVRNKKSAYLCTRNRNTTSIGEMAEWSIAAVLKTVEGNTSGGSNPSLSARKLFELPFFIVERVERR